MKVQGEFTVAHWDQEPVEGFPEQMSVARASVVYEASGEIAGKLTVEYLMYCADVGTEGTQDEGAPTTYVGFMLFEGSLGEQTGSFALIDRGAYADFTPASDLSIESDSGAGDLAGITGTGRYYARDDKMIIELDYEL
ncbi:MAG: DUF3224 domain-containing protein [Coriobacteriia bacterium]|nr:DUF3224 domain-containing protein [Coriobacteriia bacterium]